MLFKLQNSEIGQSILSGLQHKLLVRHVKCLAVEHFFNKISGGADANAQGKLDRAEGLMRDSGFKRENTLIIGDTLHDAEVAQHLNIRCVLISHGFQPEQRLKTSGYPVVSSLGEFDRYIQGI